MMIRYSVMNYMLKLKKTFRVHPMIMNMATSSNMIWNIQQKLKKKPKVFHFVLIKQKQTLIFSQII